MPLLSMAEIVRYVEDLKLTFSDHIRLPTPYGVFESFAVRERVSGDPSDPASLKEHLVLTKKEVKGKRCLVRLHSRCLTGDVFGSQRCDCGAQLTASLKLMEHHDACVLIYLEQEGRDIGLFNKIRAYALQEKGRETLEANLELGLPADNRDYSVAAGILRKLAPASIDLITNNPDKHHALQAGLDIEIRRVPVLSPLTPFNQCYLQTKINKLNHTIACS
jgi:3,4-dihydroxy 2-butanone 4-phosphate synthase/GTP cyclohydrolase II